MSQGNTIDLRGHEQVANRAEAEEYAAMLGYPMYIYGLDDTVRDVNSRLMIDIRKDNPLLGITKVSELLSLLDKDSSYLIKAKVVNQGVFQVVQAEIVEKGYIEQFVQRWDTLNYLASNIYAFRDLSLGVNHAKAVLAQLGDI